MITPIDCSPASLRAHFTHHHTGLDVGKPVKLCASERDDRLELIPANTVLMGAWSKGQKKSRAVRPTPVPLVCTPDKTRRRRTKGQATHRPPT